MSDMAFSPGASAPDAATLLALEGEAFVQCAYQTLLGRDADPAGLHYYRDRIAAGYAKLSVVDAMLRSAEARQRQASVPGLAGTLKRYRQAQYPWVGAIFRWRDPQHSNTYPARQQRMLAIRLAAVQRDVEARAQAGRLEIEALHQQLAALRTEIGTRMDLLDAQRAAVQALVDDAAARQGVLNADSRRKLEGASEAVAELRRSATLDRQRVDALERELANTQQTLKAQGALPVPLDPATAQAARQLPPAARSIHERMRRAFSTGADRAAGD